MGNAEKSAGKKEKLTPTAKYTMFARHLLETGNATQSAILAGYSAETASQTGSRLAKHREVLAIMERERSSVERSLLVNKVFVLNNLADVAENGSDSARVSACEKLGKYLGMFDDRVVHSGHIDHDVIQREFIRPKSK